MKYDELKELLQKQKQRKRPRHEESEIQKSCVRWFRATYPRYLCFSVPNGGRRSALEGAILKGEGALAGVSDLIIVAYNAVLFIEIKNEKGKQSESQKRFQKQVEALGHEYKVCRSRQEFQLTVEHWLKCKYWMIDVE